MKLALGTVQFGLNYGVSNLQGQVNKSQVQEILEQALSLGINTLDCAPVYGNSEQVIGESIFDSNFNIITKIPALSNEQESLLEYFEQSLQKLQTKSLHGLLLHQANNLITHPKCQDLFQQLLSLKKQKRINEIGASLYSPEQLKTIAATYPIDIAQVPINIFDQRFLAKEIIDLCREKQIKLHVRSLFLQGLIFFNERNLPTYFSPFKEKLLAFSQLAKHLNCTELALALSIVAQDSHYSYNVIEKLIIGVCNTAQLNQIVQAYQQASTLAVTIEELKTLKDNRLELINPSYWPQKE
jgi:aryl-alcohol dehydrogenase-like predicted oxidoreductase